MMFSFARKFSFIAAGIALASATAAAEQGKVVLPKLVSVSPFASVAAVARANQIPMAGFDTFDNTNLRPGDCFTGLIAFHEKKGKQSQWLLFLQVEQGPPSPTPKKPMILHTSLGNRFEFKSSPVSVSLRTLGPFVNSQETRKQPKVTDKIARFNLDEGYLGLGLDRAAAVLLRARAEGVKQLINVKGTPFKDSEITQAREGAKRVGITPDEERAVAGSVPVLLSYVAVVRNTECLQDLLFKVLDKPSLWSLVREGGVKANLTLRHEQLASADASNWALPRTQSVFQLPFGFELNKNPALNVVLIVTNPESPLLSCGGIVGMLAEKPSDDKTFLTLSVISALRSGSRTLRTAQVQPGMGW